MAIQPMTQPREPTDDIPALAHERMITALAHERMSGEDLDLAVAFLSRYYTGTSPDDLAEREAGDLYGAAVAHLNLARRRMPDQPKVRVYNPQIEQHGWQSTHTIVEIVTDDMPFLVDSVRMVLNRRGYTSHLIVHPVLRFRAGRTAASNRSSTSTTPARDRSWRRSSTSRRTGRPTGGRSTRSRRRCGPQSTTSVSRSRTGSPCRPSFIDASRRCRRRHRPSPKRSSTRRAPFSSGSRTTTSRFWAAARTGSRGPGAATGSCPSPGRASGCCAMRKGRRRRRSGTCRRRAHAMAPRRSCWRSHAPTRAPPCTARATSTTSAFAGSTPAASSAASSGLSASIPPLHTTGYRGTSRCCGARRPRCWGARGTRGTATRRRRCRTSSTRFPGTCSSRSPSTTSTRPASVSCTWQGTQAHPALRAPRSFRSGSTPASCSCPGAIQHPEPPGHPGNPGGDLRRSGHRVHGAAVGIRAGAPLLRHPGRSRGCRQLRHRRAGRAAARGQPDLVRRPPRRPARLVRRRAGRDSLRPLRGGVPRRLPRDLLRPRGGARHREDGAHRGRRHRDEPLPPAGGGGGAVAVQALPARPPPRLALRRASHAGEHGSHR